MHIPLSLQMSDRQVAKFMSKGVKPRLDHYSKGIPKAGMRARIEAPGPVVKLDPEQFMRDRAAGLV